MDKLTTKQLEKAAKDLRKRESEHNKRTMAAFKKWLEANRGKEPEDG
jgi:hypothetical protein